MFALADMTTTHSDAFSCVTSVHTGTTWTPNIPSPLTISQAPEVAVPEHQLSSGDNIHGMSCSGQETINLLSRKPPWLLHLYGIDEDAHDKEGAVQMDSMDADISSCLPYSAEKDLTNACAVPSGICQVLQDSSLPVETNIFSSSVCVSCTTLGCNYGGPLHATCLQRWSSCCELRCRTLATHSAPGDQISGGQDLSVAQLNNRRALEHLSLLYRCPRCGNSSLCRISAKNSGAPLDDPHTSILTAIQYVNEHLNAHTNSHRNTVNVSNSISPTEKMALTRTQTNSSELTAESVGGQLHTDASVEGPPHYVAHPTKHSSWTKDPLSPDQFGQHFNQQSHLLRHLSLRRQTSITNASASSGTSGLGSSVFGSGSVDCSRRSSQNTYYSDASSDNLWVSSPMSASGPRCVRVARVLNPKSCSPLTSSKTPNYFTFGAMSPLSSEYPAPTTSIPITYNENRIRTEVINTGVGPQGRRHNSMSTSAQISPFWPGDKEKRVHLNDLRIDQKVVNRKGNIFQPRLNFNVFEKLPPIKRNAYFIQMDDDSCTGNEDTRAFLLAQLTNHRISEVHCLACHRRLVVYDHFPVIDGLFFISPLCHRTSSNATGLRISWYTHSVATVVPSQVPAGANTDPDELSANEHGQILLSSSKPVVPPPGCLGPRQQVNWGYLPSDSTASTNGSHTRYHSHAPRQERYLHALCMECIHNEMTSADGMAVETGERIRCRFCSRPWSGNTLLVGGLYTYDIFAAVPCCSAHLTCKACGHCLDDKQCVNSRLSGIQESSQESKKMDKRPQDPNVQYTSDKHASVMSTFPLAFFSQYSQLITCYFCEKVDYHFVKPFGEYYETHCCVDCVS